MFGLIQKIAEREAGITQAKKGYTEPGTEMFSAVLKGDWQEAAAIMACPDPNQK